MTTQKFYLPLNILIITSMCFLFFSCQKDKEPISFDLETSQVTGAKVIGVSYDLTSTNYQEVFQGGQKLAPSQLSNLDKVRSIPIIKKKNQSFSLYEDGSVEMDIYIEKSDFAKGAVVFKDIPPSNVEDIRRISIRNNVGKFYDSSGNFLTSRKLDLPDLSQFALMAKEKIDLSQLTLQQTLKSNGLPPLEVEELTIYLQEELGAIINDIGDGQLQVFVDLPTPVNFGNEYGDMIEMGIDTNEGRIRGISLINSELSEVVSVTALTYKEGVIDEVYTARFRRDEDGMVRASHNVRQYDNYTCITN